MKIFKVFIFFCFNSLLLTGCFDKVELEDRALVLSMGIDKYSEENDTSTEISNMGKKFIVSLAMPQVSAGEKKGNSSLPNPMEKEVSQTSINEGIKKGEGSSITSTINLINDDLSKVLYFGHTKVAILGKEILQDKNLLKETIDSLERNKEISRKTIILGTNKKAEEILQNIPKDEPMIGIYINDFYKNTNSSLTYAVDLEDIIQNLLSSGDTAIPNIEIINDNIRISGLLILKDFQLVGYLDDSLTRYLLYLIDKKSFGDISIFFENGYVPINILSKKLEKDIYEDNGKIIINFNLFLDGNIYEYSLGENILIDSEKYKMVASEASNYLTEQIQKSIDTLVSLDADILGIKELIRKISFDLYEKYNLKENNIYDYVDFKINTNIKIKGSGTVK